MNPSINLSLPAPTSCRVCGQPKTPDDFHEVTGCNGRRYKHKTCRTCYQTELQAKRYMKAYGMTLEQVRALGDSCNICDAKDVRLVVDHNHQTNKVRGRLCDVCNRGIGFLGDTPESVMKAA